MELTQDAITLGRSRMVGDRFGDAGGFMGRLDTRLALNTNPTLGVSDMYEATKWDAERRLLWFKSTPNGDWYPATMQQTIDWLAERVALLERIVLEST